MAKMTPQEIAKIKQEAIAFHKAQACSTEQAAVFAEAAVRDALENSAPDLGNTRINGTSEGLRRGARLTGRINRAVTIGEEALKQQGSAFDSPFAKREKKNSAGDVYFCGDCRAWMTEYTLGVHDRANPAHSSYIYDASGKLKGAHWSKEEKKNAVDEKNLCPQCNEPGGEWKANPIGGRDILRYGCRCCGAVVLKPADREKKNAGRENASDDKDKLASVSTWEGKWAIVDVDGRKLYGPYPSCEAAVRDFKRREMRANAVSDEGFLGAGSGMDVDAGEEAEQAQQGLGPAEDITVFGNSSAGVKRGARKYGSLKNSVEFFVSYRGGDFSGGTSRQLDDKIESLASQFGGEFMGSGGVIDGEGERDLTFKFGDSSAGQKFLSAAKTLLGGRLVGSGKS